MNNSCDFVRLPLEQAVHSSCDYAWPVQEQAACMNSSCDFVCLPQEQAASMNSSSDFVRLPQCKLRA